MSGVGNYIGIFIEANPKSFDGEWKVYVRIRVFLDIRKPLRRRMKIKKPGGDWYWVNFKYERLPTFCYFYGMLGHSENFYATMFQNPSKPTEMPYRPWLRASTRPTIRNPREKLMASTVVIRRLSCGDKEVKQLRIRKEHPKGK